MSQFTSGGKKSNRSGPKKGVARPRMSDELKRRLYEAVAARYATEGGDIAKEFGVTKPTVAMIAWRLGVEFSGNPFKKSAAARSHNSTSVNQRYFDEWSPNMAWLLGYTWADGAVRSDGRHYGVHYRCKASDGELILAIRDELRCRAAVQNFESQLVQGGKYEGEPQIGFTATSMHLVKCLVERHGIVPNKSNLDPPMPSVPDRYLCHFARGVLDGDGSIPKTRSSVLFYGTVKIMYSLRDAIVRAIGVRSPSINRVPSSDKLRRFEWTSCDDAPRVIRWLYPEGEYLHLRRKREAAERALVALAGKKPWSEARRRKKS